MCARSRRRWPSWGRAQGAAAVADVAIPAGWDESRGNAPALNRRFDFPAYRATRDFLDRLADLSEAEDYYPNLGFGTTHVNVTINARDGSALGEADVRFAAAVDALYQDMA
ncbi:4a-hydroxytetrahydrobiopterin dehydratase [Ectothiorhodospiraceae bacterium 2226]|nr:4a-hydroxytetrahydrobiopterin dehydratase [Ectothiorhodospiraceae bacterium 2226]